MGESVDKGLAAQAFPAGLLDKPEAAIIDQPARPQRPDQRLDSGPLQNHLRDLGFSAPLDDVWRGPAAVREPFRRPGMAQAEEGLLHVMGVLRERDEVREEFGQGTRYGFDRRTGGRDADRTSPSRKSTEGLDRDVPTWDAFSGGSGLAEA